MTTEGGGGVGTKVQKGRRGTRDEKKSTAGGGVTVESRPFSQARLVTDSEARRMLVTSLRAGASVQAAAAAAGVSRSSVYRTLAQGREDMERCAWTPHAEVAAEVLQARGEAQVGLVAIVRRAAQSGDWKAAAWLLERLDRAGRLRVVEEDLGLDYDASRPSPDRAFRIEIEVVACRNLTTEEFMQGVRDPRKGQEGLA